MIDLFEFPELSRSVIRTIKKSIDNSFREFSRSYGDSIEVFFYPLKVLMNWVEFALVSAPWPLAMSRSSHKYHHIEYSGDIDGINPCSWPITFGYGIIEAYMTRLDVSLPHAAMLWHRMCPDELQMDWPRSYQITISSIVAT